MNNYFKYLILILKVRQMLSFFLPYLQDLKVMVQIGEVAKERKLKVERIAFQLKKVQQVKTLILLVLMEAQLMQPSVKIVKWI
jgi:hypothetical protein